MNSDAKIARLKAQLSREYAKRHKQLFLKDAPKDPYLFDGLYLNRDQMRLIKRLNARDEKVYATYLRKSPASIRRWAIETTNIPRQLLRGDTAYGLQLNLQTYLHRREKTFIKLLHGEQPAIPCFTYPQSLTQTTAQHNLTNDPN